MASMQRFVKLVDTTFRQLCEHEPCGINENENVDFMHHISYNAQRCYELAQKYYLICKKQNFRITWDAAQFHQLWADAAAAVRDFICSYYYVLRRQRVHYDTQNDAYDTFVPAELLYSLYLKCLLNKYHGAPFESGAAFDGICQHHIPYVCKKGRLLLRSTLPIAEFGVRMLMECINQLEYRWLSLPHSIELEKYIEVLELRLAQIMSALQPELIHNVGCFRTLVRTVKLRDSSDGCQYDAHAYSYNADLLTRVTHVGLSFHRCLNVLYCIPLGSKQQLYDELLQGALSSEVMEALRATIEKKFKHVATRAAQLEDMDDIFKTNYTVLSCRPVEVVTYVDSAQSKRLRKNIRLRADPTDVLIDQRERSSYNKIIEESNMSLLEALQLSPQANHFARALAVVCLTSRIIFGRSMVNFSENYVYYRTFIFNSFHPEYTNLNQIKNDPYPLLLQSFNFFYLFYQGKQYPLENTLEGVIIWLYLVARDLQCYARGRDLDVAYRELLGPRWRTLFGFDDTEGTLQHIGREITMDDTGIEANADEIAVPL